MGKHDPLSSRGGSLTFGGGGLCNVTPEPSDTRAKVNLSSLPVLWGGHVGSVDTCQPAWWVQRSSREGQGSSESPFLMSIAC